MGRVNSMSQVGGYGGTGAVYGVAGEIDSLGYFGFSEMRQYNAMYQMTRRRWRV
jgi:hypothetical protein